MKIRISSTIMDQMFREVETTPKFIKFGRGSRNQRDPFHQAFLDEKDRLRPQYLLARTHEEKRRVQQMLLDWVARNNGSFVEESPNDKNVLVEVLNQKKLLEKAAQALRESRKRALSKAVLAAKSAPLTTKRARSKPANKVIYRDLPMVDVPVMTMMQAIRGPYSAAKAVHPTPPAPLTKHDDKNQVIHNDESKEEAKVASFHQGSNPVDDHGMMVTANDDGGSHATDSSIDEAPSMDPLPHSVTETMDVDFYMNLSKEELWSIAKELFD